MSCFQIGQHRARMLRAMFYLGTIITRIVMIISTKIITLIEDYYQVQTCTEIAFDYGGSLSKAVSLYPQYANSGPNANVIFKEAFNAGPESVGAALGLSFGMALWLSILMHLVGVERLRNVSLERQLEAGMENSGSVGLTSDTCRWGDMLVWQPARSSYLTPVLEK
jgi:hypothetical protein